MSFRGNGLRYVFNILSCFNNPLVSKFFNNLIRSVAMQPSKTKLAIAVGTLFLGASNASFAQETKTYDVTMKTIPDIGFTQITPISLGSSVYLTAGGTCTLKGDDPLAATVLAEAAVLTADTNGLLTGDCAGEGQAGVFEVISAEANASFSVVMGNMPSALGFSFNPSNSCIPLYGTGTSDDACETLPVNFAHNTAITGDGVNQGITDKTLRFTVGGVMTVDAGADLLPSDSLAGSFAINVVYL
jgi:hypothetical protein